MLTGSPPFSGNNRKKLMEQILDKKLSFPKYMTSFAKDLLTKVKLNHQITHKKVIKKESSTKTR